MLTVSQPSPSKSPAMGTSPGLPKKNRMSATPCVLSFSDRRSRLLGDRAQVCRHRRSPSPHERVVAGVAVVERRQFSGCTAQAPATRGRVDEAYRCSGVATKNGLFDARETPADVDLLHDVPHTGIVGGLSAAAKPAEPSGWTSRKSLWPSPSRSSTNSRSSPTTPVSAMLVAVNPDASVNRQRPVVGEGEQVGDPVDVAVSGVKVMSDRIDGQCNGRAITGEVGPSQTLRRAGLVAKIMKTSV